MVSIDLTQYMEHWRCTLRSGGQPVLSASRSDASLAHQESRGAQKQTKGP